MFICSCLPQRITGNHRHKQVKLQQLKALTREIRTAIVSLDGMSSLYPLFSDDTIISLYYHSRGGHWADQSPRTKNAPAFVRSSHFPSPRSHGKAMYRKIPKLKVNRISQQVFPPRSETEQVSILLQHNSCCRPVTQITYPRSHNPYQLQNAVNSLRLLPSLNSLPIHRPPTPCQERRCPTSKRSRKSALQQHRQDHRLALFRYGHHRLCLR